MTELKTLKDIEFSIGETGPFSDLTSKQKLKQEAIKWVGMCREQANKAPNEELKLCWDTGRNLFLNFFNITEEDLK